MSRLLLSPGRAALTLALASAPTSAALAHEGKPLQPHDLWAAWSWEPGVVICLALSAWLYFRGVRRLWQDQGGEVKARGEGSLSLSAFALRPRPAWGRGISQAEAAAYALGWLALVLALVSPLHPLGSVLFAAHMTQHEVLMLLAAPLLVLGRPLLPSLWALPRSWRRRLGGWGRSGWVQGVWHRLTWPLTAWSLHAVVLWAWHAPALFQATLKSELVHTAQHLSFLVSALLFCWALIHSHKGWMGYGAAVLYVFTTALHTSVLGALLTFSSTLWYPAYRETTAAWGLSPLEDQQLGGLIMWVPAGLVYIAAGLAFFSAWLRELERRVAKREAKVAAPAVLD